MEAKLVLEVELDRAGSPTLTDLSKNACCIHIHIWYVCIIQYSGGGFFRSAFKRRMENTTRSSFFFHGRVDPTRLSPIDDPWGPLAWIPLAPGRCRAFRGGGKMVLDLVTLRVSKNDRDKHPSWIKGVEVSGWTYMKPTNKRNFLKGNKVRHVVKSTRCEV